MRKILTVIALVVLLPVKAMCAEADPDLAKEIEIGRKAIARIEQEWPLTSDPAIVSKLEMIAARLEPFMSRRINWEIRLVKTEALNAFCIPGGFIFFTTGIVDALKTDSELAAVMAHEMIHADRKHSLRMAAQSNKVTLGALAAILLSGGAAAPMILAQVAQVAITSEYTKELEAEADKFGLDALIQSGYSPTGMITLFEHFMAEEYRQPIHDYGIYMNHPDTPDRLSAAVNTLHERNIPIQRKYSLGLLRTDLRETSNDISVLVDGQVVASGIKTQVNRSVLKRMRETLDKYLQLELAPYELHLEEGALYIENHFTAGEVKGITSPEKIRANLMKSINLARAKHPTSKFFK